ncbi:MAG: glycerophosphodiester phosphodiesterase family protein [Actinomycetes bacterium]
MLIYAHRGASADFPEHSQVAYEAAVKQGADGFECDIRLTQDREIICWHDSNTKRNSSKNLIISQSTFAELEFAQPLKFSWLLDFAISQGKNLAIETKHPVSTGGAIEVEILKLLKTREEDIRASGIWITIMSFSVRAVQRVKKSPFERVFLIERPLFLQDNPAQILGPGIHLVRKNPHIVKQIHKEGKKVFVWTVNDDDDVRFCNDLGVDVIMSDKPGQARAALRYS